MVDKNGFLIDLPVWIKVKQYKKIQRRVLLPQHPSSEEHQVNTVEVQSEAEQHHTNERQDVHYQSGHSEEQAQDRTSLGIKLDVLYRGSQLKREKAGNRGQGKCTTSLSRSSFSLCLRDLLHIAHISWLCNEWLHSLLKMSLILTIGFIPNPAPVWIAYQNASQFSRG